MRVTLNQSATVTLDGSGDGTARVGPLSAREVWYPANVHVSASTNTNEAQCSIYAGDAAIAQYFRDGTFSGSSGDATDRVSADAIKVGSYVWAAWTGGDAGAVATLTVTGEREI